MLIKFSHRRGSETLEPGRDRAMCFRGVLVSASTRILSLSLLCGGGSKTGRTGILSQFTDEENQDPEGLGVLFRVTATVNSMSLPSPSPPHLCKRIGICFLSLCTEMIFYFSVS